MYVTALVSRPRQGRFVVTMTFLPWKHQPTFHPFALTLTNQTLYAASRLIHLDGEDCCKIRQKPLTNFFC